MTRLEPRAVIEWTLSHMDTLAPHRRLVAILAIAGLALLLLPGHMARAGEIVVTSTSGARGGPGCTLRDAITAANTDAAAGDCPAGSGTDTITLTDGATYTLTEVDNTTLRSGIEEPNGLPSATTDITIIGNGATIARSSADGTLAFRLLHVAPGAYLTINDATLTNGMPATQPGPGGDGGGILNEGVLTLVNVAVVANSAGYASLTETVGQAPVAGCAGRGGGVFNAGMLTLAGGSVSFNHAGSATWYDGLEETCPGAGGGVYNDTAATLTLNGTTVSGNAAGSAMEDDGADGGGIFNAGILVITNSTITDNGAGYSHDSNGGNGGGIANVAAGRLTVIDSTVRNNGAGSGDAVGGHGGGICNAGTATFIRCTVSNNNAGYGTGDGNGGGLANREGGTLTLVNTTVSGNQAGNYHGEGGGIFNAGTLAVTSCTISGNSINGTSDDGRGGGVANSGPLAIVRGTLIAGNSSNSDVGLPPALGDDCYGVLTSQGYNLIQDPSNCTLTGDTTGNITSADPHIGPLQSNGGATETQALLPGSPAIDAGDPNGCTDPDGNTLSTDQRGAPRVIAGDTRCDIGAFEASWTAWPTITMTPTPTQTSTPPPPSPTPTRTPRPTHTATPTWAVAVDVGGATGLPGEQVTIAVFLKSGTQSVVAIQNDIAFDPSTPVMENSDGTPACAVNPAIRKSARFGFLRCSGWWPQSCSQIRAIVFPLDGLSPIPDGSLLYACSVAISPGATAGTHVLANSGVIASDAAGHRLPGTGGADGWIVVVSGSPALSGAPAAAVAPGAPMAGSGCSLTPARDPAHGSWLAFLFVAELLVCQRRHAPKSRGVKARRLQK
jgi:hypothetical protein